MTNAFKLLFLLLLTLGLRQAHAQFEVDYAVPREYEIARINVTGVQYLDRNTLVSIAGLAIGERIKIPGDDITMAIKKVWQRGIVGDIKIYVTAIEGDKVYLQMDLRELPRMSNFYFDGIRKGQAETLTNKIKISKGKIINDAILKSTELTVKNYFYEKGFYNCQVRIQQVRDTILSGNVYLKIIVNKGKKVKINEIEFEGLSQIKESKLRKKMKKTKQRRFGRIFSPSKYIVAEYKKDKEKIIEYYNENGYRNALILSDSVWKHDKRSVNIKLRIEEGRKFFYRNIFWKGNRIYSDTILNQYLAIKRGDVYNPEELAKKLNFNPAGNDITSLYMDDGYLFFTIDPVEVGVEGDSIDVEMRIFEGEQATINKIIVNGNAKTSDHVIYREIRTVPGQKFSRSDLIRTQRELASLGYFDGEKIGMNPKPNFADGTVDIEYNLTERPNDQIELSGGWGGFLGFVGTVGLVFNNFSIRNIPNFNKWRPLPSGDGQRLALRVQANGRRFQSYSLTLTEPWLGGRQPNSFSVSLSHSVQNILGGRSFTDRIGGMTATSISFTLGRRLKRPDDFFTMSNALTGMVYNLDNFTGFGFGGTGLGGFTNGQSFNITLNSTLARNSIDNPTFPRSGSSVSLSLSMTPPYSLLENNRESAFNDRFRWVEYHKWMFDNSWFTRIAGNLVLNTRFHMGFLGTYNSTKGLAPFERFIMGGSGMMFNTFLLGTDIIGLRGYNDNSLNAGGAQGGGVVFNKFVTELRYPISLNPSATIFVLGFAEGGNNWANFQEFSPFNLKRSVGMGARVFMPAFGLIGIDYGWGFDPIQGSPGANRGQFHFTIGQLLR